MPRGDGTGPMGQGPMTGRGAGYCAGFDRPGYASQAPGRGFGMGWSGGRGRGWGGGWRRGGRFYAPNLPRTFSYVPPVSAYDEESEVKFLRAEAARMKDALGEIEKRLVELEGEE